MHAYHSFVRIGMVVVVARMQTESRQKANTNRYRIEYERKQDSKQTADRKSTYSKRKQKAKQKANA